VEVEVEDTAHTHTTPNPGSACPRSAVREPNGIARQ
jgi:hypothetical protein